MKNTIQQIKNQVEILEKNLSTFKAGNKGIDWDQTINGENTYRDYVDLTDFIIAQLKFLIKSNLIFAQITTYDDRNNIHIHLQSLNSVYQDIGQGYEYLNLIIKLLQPLSFYTLSRGKFADDLMVEISEMLKKKNELENQILEFQNIKEKNSIINTELEKKFIEIKEKYENSITNLEKIEDSYISLNDKLENAKTESEQITLILTDTKSNKGVIDSFVKQVSSREEQLVNQETKTENYEKKLKDFQDGIESRILEADDLIKQSEEVLNLKTAEGISAAFNSQYGEASKKWVFALWLSFSLVFLGLAVWIGWLLLSAQSQDLPTVIARISLLPILLTGSYFTANQYVKQKNIAEDYAYKQVLSKSLVGFSKEILKQSENKNPEYSQFVTKVFEQMLQDPLRNRKEKSFELDRKSESLIDTMTKLLAEINKINKS